MKGELSYYADESAECRRIGYLEGRAKFNANRIQPDANWLTTEQATNLLGIGIDRLSETRARHAIKSKSRSRNSDKAQAVGRLWWRPDLERVKLLRRECQIGFKVALRVLDAQKSGRI